MQVLPVTEGRISRPTLAVVSISGGKDSTATGLRAIQTYGRSQCRFVFADPGNEHEVTLEYVHDYLPSVLGPIETVRAEFSRNIARKRVYDLRDGKTAAQIFQRMRIAERVRWAETARGGRQTDFIRQAVSPACSSVYGLCE